jgi:hypothetical protein
MASRQEVTKLLGHQGRDLTVVGARPATRGVNGSILGVEGDIDIFQVNGCAWVPSISLGIQAIWHL